MKIITKMIKLFENNVVLAKKFTINKLYVQFRRAIAFVCLTTY